MNADSFIDIDSPDAENVIALLERTRHHLGEAIDQLSGGVTWTDAERMVLGFVLQTAEDSNNSMTDAYRALGCMLSNIRTMNKVKEYVEQDAELAHELAHRLMVPMGNVPSAEDLKRTAEEHPELKDMDMGDMWPSRMTRREADE